MVLLPAELLVLAANVAVDLDDAWGGGVYGKEEKVDLAHFDGLLGGSLAWSGTVVNVTLDILSTTLSLDIQAFMKWARLPNNACTR